MNDAEPTDDEEFASVWKSSYVAEDADTLPVVSTISLACRLTEIVSDLKDRSAQAQVDNLNTLFDTMRHTAEDTVMRKNAVDALNAELERLSADHVDLVGKLSDMQSQLDAWQRRS
jgi:hypothetical protein